MSDTSSESIGVVIVTYRSRDPLVRLLDDLCQFEPGLPLVVVDNASPEGPPAVPDSVGLLVRKENNGYGSACNDGVRALPRGPDFIAFLNPDVRLADSSLTQIAQHLARHPGVGVATGPVVDSQGGRLASAWGRTSIVRALWSATGWRLPRARRMLARVIPGGAGLSSRSMRSDTMDIGGHVLGGTMVVRRACFDDIGGFDESYFLYWEDADLCARARAAGWKIMLLPSTPLIHLEGTSSAGVTGKERWNWYREGADLFATKHLSRGQARTMRLAMTAGEFIGRRRR
jgi:N-acetylglucosaminyl-diphospho-decaprenol L-rhamnosyltransferase